MEISFVEKKYKASQHFKDVVTEKLSKLDKYFAEPATAKVYCSKINKTEKLEINVSCKGVIFRSEVDGNNNYENIDLALPKLERQIVRSKQKFLKGKRKSPKGADFEFLAEAPDMELPEVVKTKVFDLDPTTIDEARDAIERLGHSFYVFLNANTGKVNVLYKRKDDKLGLIEINF